MNPLVNKLHDLLIDLYPAEPDDKQAEKISTLEKKIQELQATASAASSASSSPVARPPAPSRSPTPSTPGTTNGSITPRSRTATKRKPTTPFSPVRDLRGFFTPTSPRSRKRQTLDQSEHGEPEQGSAEPQMISDDLPTMADGGRQQTASGFPSEPTPAVLPAAAFSPAMARPLGTGSLTATTSAAVTKWISSIKKTLTKSQAKELESFLPQVEKAWSALNAAERPSAADLCIQWGLPGALANTATEKVQIKISAVAAFITT